MPAFEEEMRSLRRTVRHWLEWIRGARGAESTASTRLARDLGLPRDPVSHILERTAADLRELSEADDDVDARPIIERAVNELASLGVQSRPSEEATMECYLRELPERDYLILRHFKLGKKHSEIAELMGTDVESVRSSLVKTYADLRIRLISSTDDDGGGEPAHERPQRSTTYAKAPLKQTSVHN